MKNKSTGVKSEGGEGLRVIGCNFENVDTAIDLKDEKNPLLLRNKIINSKKKITLTFLGLILSFIGIVVGLWGLF